MILPELIIMLTELNDLTFVGDLKDQLLQSIDEKVWRAPPVNEKDHKEDQNEDNYQSNWALKSKLMIASFLDIRFKDLVFLSGDEIEETKSTLRNLMIRIFFRQMRIISL
jgi:hypothetical protein